MDYQQAAKIRKKSFGTLLAEHEGGLGQSLKAAISQKTKARMEGIKEKFDPLNIAKKLTGGSNWAPAMLGKMFGVDKKRVDYFSGVKSKNTASLQSSESLNSPEVVECLGYIYKSLKQSISDRHQAEKEDKESKQKEEDTENDRNEELVKALTGRRKKKEKKEPYRDEKGRFAKQPPKEQVTPPKEQVTPPKETFTEKIKNVVSVVKPSPIVSTAAKVATGAAIITAGLGSASAKFESKGDASTVSSGKNDPGGVSYGTYQMSSVAGVADDFVKKSNWKTDFEGLKAGTPEFSAKWKQIAKDPKQGKEFADAQHEYIKKTHFDPAAAKAIKMGYQLNDPGVADAIWSLSVQHAGVQTVLDLSKQNMGGIINEDPKEQIKSLYKARSDYVNGNIKLGEGMKASIQNRYSQEVGYALDKSTGNQIDNVSKENKNLKADATQQEKSASSVNTNTINQKTQQDSSSAIEGDDRNAYLKKKAKS
jgi:hypothetical protein